MEQTKSLGQNGGEQNQEGERKAKKKDKMFEIAYFRLDDKS